MHFSVATVFTAVLAAASTASAFAINPSHLAIRDEVTVRIRQKPALERRGAGASIAKSAGTEAAKQAAKLAIQSVGNLLKDIQNWDRARQTFTKETTKQMMDANTNPAFVAAACYNKGYAVQNPDNVDGKTSVSFKLGSLHTDYDCMYLKAPNAFWTESDGGYQNLAYRYTNACTFDRNTQDLTCK